MRGRDFRLRVVLCPKEAVRVEVTDAYVRVGALVRHARLLADESAYAALPLLRQALLNVAHPAVRNRGTTVGSIAHADAAGEMPSVLAITDGILEAVGPDGRREIAAADFFTGAMETTLAHDEIVEAVRFGRFPAAVPTLAPPRGGVRVRRPLGCRCVVLAAAQR